MSLTQSTVADAPSAESIEISAGETSVNFDALEEVTSAKVVTDKESTAPHKGEKPKELKKDTSKDPVEQKSNTKTEQKETQDTKDEKTQIDPSVKTLKVKQGESEIDLRSDALIPVKVDGETKLISVQDVINDYSGRSSLDKKYQEIKKQRDTFESDRNTLNGYIESAHKFLVEDKDMRGFIDLVAESMGQDADTLYSETMQNFETEIKKYLDVPDHERKTLQLERDAAYYKKKAELVKKQETEKRLISDRKSKLENLISETALSPESFDKYKTELVAAGFTEDQILDKPEIVKTYKSNLERIDHIETTLKEIATDIEADAIDGLVSKYAGEFLKAGLNKTEISEVLGQLHGGKNFKATKKLNEVIEKKQKRAESERTTTVNPAHQALFFDDLE